MSESQARSAAVAIPVPRTGAVTLQFQEFFEAEYERLGRALYVLTGSVSEADELAQEAMVKVYERWHRVSGMDSPAGYLYRTAMNLYRSRLRQIKSRASKHIAPDPEPDGFEAVEDRDQLRRLIATLPDGERQALALVEVLGLSTEEAGEVLNVEAVSVRVRLSRARARLRRQVGVGDG
jgi:RNA polymerase sigma-70 factor (ECF subfamily)